MNFKILLHLLAVNAIVIAGAFSYLLSPSLMDLLWSISFSCALLLLGHSIYREMGPIYNTVSAASAIVLAGNFVSAMENFWVSALGISVHRLVTTASIFTFAACLLVFARGEHKDLKLVAIIGLSALLIGFVGGAEMGRSAL